MKPNIFEISTKELTQDGFITWLLKWADPSNKKYDEKLNQCAIDFANYLIKEQTKEDIEIIKVEADRQWKNIDIWADVNEKYFIIIENKTYTNEHSNQLEKYKKLSLDWCKEHNRNLICIYLKTGSEAKSSLGAIKDRGFLIVGRKELITFFQKYSIKNDIYNDFYNKIINIENAEKAFETKIINDWDWSCWTGFYDYLDTALEITEWKMVSNPSGGFLGIWWHFREWKNYYVYLQIEQKQGNLCFKIGEVYENHQEARDEWYNILMKKANEKNKKEIVKPPRFGSGTNMTVARIERKDWLGNDNELIEKENVIKKLKEYEIFLDYTLEGIKEALI